MDINTNNGIMRRILWQPTTNTSGHQFDNEQKQILQKQPSKTYIRILVHGNLINLGI